MLVLLMVAAVADAGQGLSHHERTHLDMFAWVVLMDTAMAATCLTDALHLFALGNDVLALFAFGYIFSF